MRIVLDFFEVYSKDDLHDLLQESFDFPEEYGRNLDAAYDYLTSIPDETDIILEHVDCLEESLGRYAEAFLQMMEDAAEENENITLIQ